MDTGREAVDFGLLTCGNVRQVIDRAGEVGDFFFELFHGVGLGARVRRGQGREFAQAGCLEYLWKDERGGMLCLLAPVVSIR